ncbi:MAG: hypothetical protein ACM3VS_13290 [Candidatus Dadabacteria bacterium]
MRSDKDIDAGIQSFIETERKLAPNPFLATRVMALIDNNNVQKRWVPTWEGIVIAFSLLLAVAGGITAGSLYKPANLTNSTTAVVLINGETMEHFGFYQETSNEK